MNLQKGKIINFFLKNPSKIALCACVLTPRNHGLRDQTLFLQGLISPFGINFPSDCSFLGIVSLAPENERSQGATERREPWLCAGRVSPLRAPRPGIAAAPPHQALPRTDAHRDAKGKQGLDMRPWSGLSQQSRGLARELPWEDDGRVTRGARCPQQHGWSIPKRASLMLCAMG